MLDLSEGKQAVPPDEHGWIERFGCTARYRRFREGVREYYRRHYPLRPEVRNDPRLNPGNGWVSPLCHEPRVALAQPPAEPAVTQPAVPSVPAPAAAAQPAPVPAPAPARSTSADRPVPRVMDTLDLGTTSITGNAELPKVLYIVPWKKSDLGELVGRPVHTLLDEVLAPVDPAVFERQLSYYDSLYGHREEE